MQFDVSHMHQEFDDSDLWFCWNVRQFFLSNVSIKNGRQLLSKSMIVLCQFRDLKHFAWSPFLRLVWRCGQLMLLNSWNFVWCSDLLEYWIRSLFESMVLVVLSGLGSRRTHQGELHSSVHGSFVVLGPTWERRSLLQDTCLAIFYIPDAVYWLLW